VNPRGALAPGLVLALALVASAAASSPRAHPVPDRGTVDLLASAHPTTARPAATDAAYSATRLSGLFAKADTAALTSATCDGCAGTSTALHVVYLPQARRADLDNVATAWAQECQGCTGTALSVQVAVLGGRPTVLPDNRALSLTAACEGCQVSALAFQVVLVADRAKPMTREELAGLRAWFDEQAAALQASVASPPPPTPDEPTSSPTPTPTPTATPMPDEATRTRAPDSRRARRDAASALDELADLLSTALQAETVAADVDLSR
jgi:hypothetical protein